MPAPRIPAQSRPGAGACGPVVCTENFAYAANLSALTVVVALCSSSCSDAFAWRVAAAEWKAKSAILLGPSGRSPLGVG